MAKDQSYHEEAIKYNEEIADHAAELATRLKNPDIKHWANAVEKQHRFHIKRHQAALEKLQSNGGKSAKMPKNVTPKTVAEEQAEFAAAQVEEEHYRDAGTGQYVTEEYAEAHPETTVEEHDVEKEVSEVHDPEPMDVPVDDHIDATAAEPVDASPDASMAAEPVDAGVEVTTVPNDETQDVTSEAGVETPAEDVVLEDGCVNEHSKVNACYFNPNAGE